MLKTNQQETEEEIKDVARGQETSIKTWLTLGSGDEGVASRKPFLVACTKREVEATCSLSISECLFSIKARCSCFPRSILPVLGRSQSQTHMNTHKLCGTVSQSIAHLAVFKDITMIPGLPEIFTYFLFFFRGILGRKNIGCQELASTIKTLSSQKHRDSFLKHTTSDATKQGSVHRKKLGSMPGVPSDFYAMKSEINSRIKTQEPLKPPPLSDQLLESRRHERWNKQYFKVTEKSHTTYPQPRDTRNVVQRRRFRALILFLKRTENLPNTNLPLHFKAMEKEEINTESSP